jgi:hypothetical protein
MGLLWRITGLGLELIEMHRVATQAGARNELSGRPRLPTW